MLRSYLAPALQQYITPARQRNGRKSVLAQAIVASQTQREFINNSRKNNIAERKNIWKSG